MKQHKKINSSKLVILLLAAVFVAATLALSPWQIKAEDISPVAENTDPTAEVIDPTADSLDPEADKAEDAGPDQQADGPEPSAETPEPLAADPAMQGENPDAQGDDMPLQAEDSQEGMSMLGAPAPVFDAQPSTLAEVQAAITAYETEYNAAMQSGGYPAASMVKKPHWEQGVPASLIPEGYNCQLVDWDDTFAAQYYTIFVSMRANAYGSAGFLNAPPGGPPVTDYFYIIGGEVDTVYNNVAIITRDEQNKFGAMWSKQKLDLREPFSTEIYLHLGHKAGVGGTVADGMTFTIQNSPDGLGAKGGVGEGLGVYQGRTSDDSIDGSYVKNALVVEFDTYFNSRHEVKDPMLSAHVAVVEPKQNFISMDDHKNSFAFMVTQEWVKFTAEWVPDETKTGGTLKYNFGGTQREYVVASNQETFGGDMAHWGFTGTTGEYTALQAGAIVKLPIPAVQLYKDVFNPAGISINGKTADVGDILTYKVRMSVQQGQNLGPLVFTDVISDNSEYVPGSMVVNTNYRSGISVIPSITGQTITVNTGQTLEKANDWIELVFKVKVKDSASGDPVTNVATINAPNLEEQESNETRVTILEKHGFAFYKTDKSGKPLAGATFEVYECIVNHEHGAGCSWNGSSLKLSAQTSDIDGVVNFSGLASGVYILVEKNPAPGYSAPEAGSYIVLSIAQDGSITMTGFKGFAAEKNMIVDKGSDPYVGYYKVCNEAQSVRIQVKKVISNFDSQTKAVQSELKDRLFVIKLSGGVDASTVLKHDQATGYMDYKITGNTLVRIKETVPMEFLKNYSCTAAITDAKGNQSAQSGPLIVVRPGDTVHITVYNTFEPAPFFKASDFITNEFK